MKATQRLALFIITLVLPCHASQLISKWKPTINNVNKGTTPSGLHSKDVPILLQHQARPIKMAGDVTTKHEELRHTQNSDSPVINIMVEAELPPLKKLQRRVVMVAKRVRDVVCTRKVARIVARRLLLVVINKFIISKII